MSARKSKSNRKKRRRTIKKVWSSDRLRLISDGPVAYIQILVDRGRPVIVTEASVKVEIVKSLDKQP